jgi:hypothetical protein
MWLSFGLWVVFSFSFSPFVRALFAFCIFFLLLCVVFFRGGGGRGGEKRGTKAVVVEGWS